MCNAVTESWIETVNRDFEGEYNIAGYKIFQKDRTQKVGEGVVLYAKEKYYPFQKISEYTENYSG